MAKNSFKQLADNISKNENIQKMIEGFHNLSEDLKKKEKEFKKSFDNKTDAQIEKAWKQYQKLVKVLSVKEEKLESKVKKTVKKVKISADKVEKKIMKAKADARAKTKKVERKVMKKVAKKKVATKKAAKATTKKKTTSSAE